MELKLKLIDINETDVITTSGLCTFDGTGFINISGSSSKFFDAGKSYKCDHLSHGTEYYEFVDLAGNASVTYVDNVLGVDGNPTGGDIVAGKYYHCYKDSSFNYYFRECDNPDHHGNFLSD